MRKLVLILFSMISFAVFAQNKIIISSFDYNQALEVTDSVFGPTEMDTANPKLCNIVFGKDGPINNGFQMGSWYKFKIACDCILSFEIAPVSKENIYGFSLHKYSDGKVNFPDWFAKPIAKCFDFDVKRGNVVGMKTDTTQITINPKTKRIIGPHFLKPFSVKKGEVYYLHVVFQGMPFSHTETGGNIHNQNLRPFYLYFHHTSLAKFNEPIILKNVLFETGKTNLLPQSNKELDGLVSKMKLKTSMTISISGHTDNQGNENDNLKLSEGRAKAVEDYLISKGIDKSRITHLGYGSKKPIASNDTEDGRKQNRRVEFTIIKE